MKKLSSKPWRDADITPEIRAMAEKAAKWVASPKGQAAIEEAIQIAKEVTDQMRSGEQSYI